MYPFFNDYIWREGKPVGKGIVKSEAALAYRIVMDPYKKWISIEMYKRGHFTTLLYDSRFLDFRKLNAKNQLGWRKTPFGSDESWIYNEEDRLILREKATPSECFIYSLHGVLLCRYALFTEKAQVVLYDAHSHPVMMQSYRTYSRGEFIDLQKEEWSISEGNSSSQRLPD